MTEKGLTLGALGGPQTFNAMAAERLRQRYTEFGDIVFFPTSEATMKAALDGDVDAACGQEQTSMTGFHAGMQARMSAPDSPLYVIAETSQRYDCSLLGKRGCRPEMVSQVLGHTGSIAHSRHWLEENLPNATIATVETSSVGAARQVVDGDGSTACVGSPNLAREFGLFEMVGHIDDGSVVNYWAVSTTPRFSESPTRLVVAGRFGERSGISRLVDQIGKLGYDLQAAYPKATGMALYEFDYLFRFRGAGQLAPVRDILARFQSARLAGAWQARD